MIGQEKRVASRRMQSSGVASSSSIRKAGALFRSKIARSQQEVILCVKIAPTKGLANYKAKSSQETLSEQAKAKRKKKRNQTMQRVSMPKRRGRKKQPLSNKDNCEQDGASPNKKEESFQDDEVERQIAAIRAVRDVEIEQLRTKIRLLRSNFIKDQPQVPVLQFFKDSLPNLSISESGKEVNWKDAHNHADERTLHTSLLHQMSIATGIPSLAGGFEFSNKSVKTGIFGVDKLQIRSLVFEEPPDSQIKDGLQTPDVSNNKLSVGFTPKTIRLPKCGEVLLSVHGSPLGVYKEDNMETIQEIEDG